MPGSFRKMLRMKIHRAVVTEANLAYEGSITIPTELMERADIREYEAVHVWNVTSGTRFETYAIRGNRGSNAVCVNGAAAHLVQPGDRVILACYVDIAEELVDSHRPFIIFVDENNREIESRLERPQTLSA